MSLDAIVCVVRKRIRIYRLTVVQTQKTAHIMGRLLPFSFMQLCVPTDVCVLCAYGVNGPLLDEVFESRIKSVAGLCGCSSEPPRKMPRAF